MEATFSILLYKDIVKINYNNAITLPHNLFIKFHVIKIEIPGNGIMRKIIRWRIKRFIKKELLQAEIITWDMKKCTFEFLDFDSLNYTRLFS